MIENFDKFLNEKLGVNKDVKKITSFIFNLVMENLTGLKNNKILVFKNILQNNYGDLIFFNDVLIFKIDDNFNAGILDQNNKNGIVTSLRIEFNVDMANIKMLKKTINHELSHVIENLYSKELSKDWIIYRKLKIHQKKYEHCDFWIYISNMFYETLRHELRSRTSETYELLDLSNSRDLKELNKIILTLPEYKNLNSILKLNPNDILIIMKQKYSNYNEILTDFMLNVFNKKYTEENFIKLIENIKNRVKKQLKKLLRPPNLFLYKSEGYFETHEYKEFDYSEYIEKNIKNNK